MTIIVTDTTCGLPLQTLADLGIPVLPQIVIFGETSYRDDSELDTAGFLQKLRAAPELPKTAAPPPALFNPIFEKLAARGDTIICLHPSSKLSGTVRSAEVAAQDFPDADIRILDTQTIAGNLATLVLLADQMAKAGMSADVILGRMRQWMARQRTYFLVDTLEYLQKGGRIGGAKALLGEMLQIKPILTMREGQVEPYEQQRTKKRALARLAEIVQEQCPSGPDSNLCIMQADAIDTAEEMAAELKIRLDLRKIPIYELPAAIVVHAGPGVLAVGFFAPMV